MCLLKSLLVYVPLYYHNNTMQKSRLGVGRGISITVPDCDMNSRLLEKRKKPDVEIYRPGMGLLKRTLPLEKSESSYVPGGCSPIGFVRAENELLKDDRSSPSIPGYSRKIVLGKEGSENCIKPRDGINCAQKETERKSNLKRRNRRARRNSLNVQNDIENKVLKQDNWAVSESSLDKIGRTLVGQTSCTGFCSDEQPKNLEISEKSLPSCSYPKDTRYQERRLSSVSLPDECNARNFRNPPLLTGQLPVSRIELPEPEENWDDVGDDKECWYSVNREESCCVSEEENWDTSPNGSVKGLSISKDVQVSPVINGKFVKSMKLSACPLSVSSDRAQQVLEFSQKVQKPAQELYNPNPKRETKSTRKSCIIISEQVQQSSDHTKEIDIVLSGGIQSACDRIDVPSKGVLSSGELKTLEEENASRISYQLSRGYLNWSEDVEPPELLFTDKVLQKSSSSSSKDISVDHHPLSSSSYSRRYERKKINVKKCSGKENVSKEVVDQANQQATNVHNVHSSLDIDDGVAGILVLPLDSQRINSTNESANANETTLKQLFDPDNPSQPIIIKSASTRNQNHISSIKKIQRHDTFEGPPYMYEKQTSGQPLWFKLSTQKCGILKNHGLIPKIERADRKMTLLLSGPNISEKWHEITVLRKFFQKCLKILVTEDIKFCQMENVEHHLWKVAFYDCVEYLRKKLAEGTNLSDAYKTQALDIIKDGCMFLEDLLKNIEETYKFKVDTFISGPEDLSGAHRHAKYAILSAQKIYLYLGDLYRYEEHIKGTQQFVQAKQCYSKAHALNRRYGRPCYQLGLIHVLIKRKFEAVYYYVRSYLASTPVPSARECLLTLFEQNRKRYDSLHRKRLEDRDLKHKEKMKDKEGLVPLEDSLRREIWIHPKRGSCRYRFNISSDDNVETEDEELSKLAPGELNKQFLTSFLAVHGKLFSRVGMETFYETAQQTLREFRALVNNSPPVITSLRLQHLIMLNIFGLEHSSSREFPYFNTVRPAVQEHAVCFALEMFNIIVEKCNKLLKEREHISAIRVGEEFLDLLPSMKMWSDWMIIHCSMWNPPPRRKYYQTRGDVDVWTQIATMVNFLKGLTNEDILENPKEGYTPVILPEDELRQGYVPFMGLDLEQFFVNSKEDYDLSCHFIRINKLVFFGKYVLCGLDPPVLKIVKDDIGGDHYESVVEYLSVNSSSDQASSDMNNSLADTDDDNLSHASLLSDETTAVIYDESKCLSLSFHKLSFKPENRLTRHEDLVEAILEQESVRIEMEVIPYYLVFDTNCFIDHLSSIEKLADSGKTRKYHYWIMVPIVVVRELEGLAKGSRGHNPDHVVQVAEAAREALAYLQSRHPRVRSVTTKGTMFSTANFPCEDETYNEEETNDDKILLTAINLSKRTESEETTEGRVRKLFRDVVLLTEDRNLRIKALVRDVAVRGLSDFLRWTELG